MPLAASGSVCIPWFPFPPRCQIALESQPGARDSSLRSARRPPARWGPSRQEPELGPVGLKVGKRTLLTREPAPLGNKLNPRGAPNQPQEGSRLLVTAKLHRTQPRSQHEQRLEHQAPAPGSYRARTNQPPPGPCALPKTNTRCWPSQSCFTYGAGHQGPTAPPAWQRPCPLPRLQPGMLQSLGGRGHGV